MRDGVDHDPIDRKRVDDERVRIALGVQRVNVIVLDLAGVTVVERHVHIRLAGYTVHVEQVHLQVVELSAWEMTISIACRNITSFVASKYRPTQSNVFFNDSSSPIPMTKGFRKIPFAEALPRRHTDHRRILRYRR